MIESKQEFNDLVNRLKELNRQHKLSQHLQSKLEAFEEVNELINLSINDVVGQSEQLNCQHEWNWGSFDCFGFPISKYCDKCGKEEAI